MTDLIGTEQAPIPVEALPEQKLAWFIIHTYSGYEAKVMESLRQRIKMESRDPFFGDIQIRYLSAFTVRELKPRPSFSMSSFICWRKDACSPVSLNW